MKMNRVENYLHKSEIAFILLLPFMLGNTLCYYDLIIFSKMLPFFIAFNISHLVNFYNLNIKNIKISVPICLIILSLPFLFDNLSYLELVFSSFFGILFQYCLCINFREGMIKLDQVKYNKPIIKKLY